MPAPPDARAPDASRARRARRPDASCIRRVPRRSACGALRCDAASAAARISSADRLLAGQQLLGLVHAHGARPCRRQRHAGARIVPSAFSDTCTAAAAVAKSPTLRSTFWYEPAVRSSGTGNSAPSAISPSPTAVVKLSTRKSSIGTRRVPALPRTTTVGARGERDRRPVAGRIVVAQAADDRAHLAHDRIGDHARRVVDQAPAALADPRRALDVAVSRDRADRQHLIADAQVVQIGQRVDVDQDGGTRESKPHGRNEALPAGQHAGLGPVLLQMRERFVCRCGPEGNRRLQESRRQPPASQCARGEATRRRKVILRR